MPERELAWWTSPCARQLIGEISTVSAGRTPVSDAPLQRSEWHERMIRTWLLALLRFAVTLENADRLEALAIGTGIDKLNLWKDGEHTFNYFCRTTVQLCHAITAPQEPANNLALRRHLMRIEDARIKRAFAAVLDLDHARAAPAVKAGKRSSELWRGLSR